VENLARYIIRASFSQERMTYIPDESKVVYKSKDSKDEKTFDALEWIVPLPAGCSHVPNKGESRKAGLLWILQPRVSRGPGSSGEKGIAMNLYLPYLSLSAGGGFSITLSGDRNRKTIPGDRFLD